MAEVWQRRARILVRLGRLVEAVEAYREYIRQTPTSVGGFLELSGVFLQLQRPEDARSHAELAARLAESRASVDRAAAYEMLARIALARADGEEARRYARLAESADTTLALRDYIEGRLAHAAGRYDKAWSAFSRAIDATTVRTIQIRELHLYAGDTLANLGRFDEAEREFQLELRSYPENTWAYLSLANLYQAMGRAADAESVLAAMLRAVPSPDAQVQAVKLRGHRAPAAGEKH
jgi:tetratricopeptide (TPR) repeat protein